MRSRYLKGAHISRARHTAKAANYCMKEKNYWVRDNSKKKQPSGGGDVPAAKVGGSFDDVVDDIVNGCSLKHIVTTYPRQYARRFGGIHKLLMYYQKQLRPAPEIIWCYGGTGTGKSQWISENVRGDSVYWHSGKYQW